MGSSKASFGKSPRRFHAGLGLALISAAFALSSVALAEPSAADRETARALMAQGDELFEKKDYAGALKNYQAGHAIVDAPSTGLAVASCLQAMGSLIEAREAALAATRMPVRPGEPPTFATARTDAARMADELGTRIPSIRVTVNGPSSTEGVRVTVDNSALPQAVIGLPRKINPGHHVVAASAPNFRDMTLEVDVSERENRILTFGLVSTEVSAAPPAPPVITTPVTPDKKSEPSQTSSLVWIGFGVGVVGLAVGATTGGISLAKASDVKSHCQNSVCPAADESTANTSRTLATVSNISFGVGLAGVALGVVGLLSSGPSTDPSTQPPTSARARTPFSVTPVLSLSNVGVVGTF
jgi:hypothetical protein